MSDDGIARLRHEQGNIRGAFGLWGTDELADGCAAGAAVTGFGGDPGTLNDIARTITAACEAADQAREVLRQLRNKGLGAGWVGDAHVAASQAAEALFTDINGLADAMRAVPARIEAYAGVMQQSAPVDAAAVDSLNDVAGRAARMTALGLLPDLSDYDGEEMAGLHHRAMQAIDDRVGAHEGVRDAGRDLAALLRDHAANARGRRLAGSPLGALDEVVLAEAGNTWFSPEGGILTPAQEDRAAAALSGLSVADRQAMMQLLASAASPEQRAYLLKMLAAGYPVGDVSRFNGLIAAHGGDPEWLAAHLSPFTMDAAGTSVYGGKQWNTFDAKAWTQGQYPTCVASSTVAARAAVDPLYALELTTGGHPGDPAYDNGDAFAQRLRAEQAQVYDAGRDWTQKLPLVGSDGMTNEQSATIADEQIATHTGASYENVDMDGEDGRYETLPQIEQAVDEGYPVPISTRGGGEGHQMMIIGHQDGQLQIYNPWGYTYWVSEDAFSGGDVSGGEQGLPGTPVSVRLPRGVS
ncbi:hypothetical protein ACIA5D_36995 [Actinoplanes sp. NPDC051513]|uniref:hypothetical protein n=1 Tax=Actinoplanes sp. NPDC051513 TaxID=3363908 RepID=UPI0037A020C8